MAINPDDKGAARLARPGAAFKQYWVLFIGKITAAQPFEYSEGRGITPVRMKRYANHAWRADATNLLIVSPTGGGKTFLAC